MIEEREEVIEGLEALPTVGGLWAEKYVATENMNLFYSYYKDPEILAVSYNVVLKITKQTNFSRG